MSYFEERERMMPKCQHRKRVNGMEMCGAICIEQPYDMMCECFDCDRRECPKKRKENER